MKSYPDIEKIFMPIFDSIGEPVVYEGELYGLSYEEAKKRYEELMKEGFYDERDSLFY